MLQEVETNCLQTQQEVIEKQDKLMKIPLELELKQHLQEIIEQEKVQQLE